MANTVNRTIRSVLIIVTYIATVVVNYLAQFLPLNGVTAAEVSDSMPTLFAPAGYTFAIWGVIYFFLGAMVLYRIGAFGNVSSALLKSTDDWLIICSGFANIAWIFSWHYDMIWLSMVFMVVLLLSLIVITTNLSENAILQSANANNLPLLAKICVYAFDIYLGWIVAATIANLSVLLVKSNWNRFGLSEEFWTVVVLIAGALIGMLFIFISRRYMSSLAIVWAYCGILIRHISPSGYGGAHPLIITIAIIGIFLILVSMLIREYIFMS